MGEPWPDQPDTDPFGETTVGAGWFDPQKAAAAVARRWPGIDQETAARLAWLDYGNTVLIRKNTTERHRVMASRFTDDIQQRVATEIEGARQYAGRIDSDDTGDLAASLAQSHAAVAYAVASVGIELGRLADAVSLIALNEKDHHG